MIQVRPAAERGRFDFGWLDTRHTFSFGEYLDPAHMGVRSLRVINEDRVKPGAGFPTHPHRSMEIVTYVLDGALEHRDSMGNGSVIRPGDVQRMSAGTGVTHSEYNPSREDPVHLLQIWLLPARPGGAPSYEQRTFPAEERRGTLRLLASPDGAEGSLSIGQDARILGTLLEPGERARYGFADGRGGWVQVARGRIRLGETELAAGDGAHVEGEDRLDLTALEPSEALLFDLA